MHHGVTRALVTAGPAAVAALAPHLPWKHETDVRLRRSLAWFHGRAHCDPAHSVAVLTEFLSDPDSPTRAEAATSLGLRADPAAGPVLQRALSHPDRAVRARAAIALGQCRVHAARGRLAELVQDDHDRDVRRAAATALRLLGRAR